MATTIYYVDPTTGDNANDGLTPATALADFFKDVGATQVDDAQFWVRRDTVVTTATTQVFTHFSVIGWPEVDDHMYADRPAAGQSAWDADATGRPTLDVTADVMMDVRGADAVLLFANFTFLDAGVQQPYFYASYGTFDFINCDITHTRANTTNGAFLQASKSGTAPLIYRFDAQIKDSTYNADAGYMFSTDSGSTADYPKYFIVDNVVVSCYSLFNICETVDNAKLSINSLIIKDSHIYFAGNAISYDWAHDNASCTIILDFQNTEFSGNNNLLWYKTDAVRHVHNSSIYISSVGCTYDINGIIFTVCSFGYSSKPMYVREFVFKDNIVNRASDILFLYSGYPAAQCQLTVASDIVFDGNYFNISGSLVHSTKKGSTSSSLFWSSGTLYITNNEYANVLNIFYTEYVWNSTPNKLVLFEKNMSLSGYLQNQTFDDCVIGLSDSNINGSLGYFSHGVINMYMVGFENMTSPVVGDVRYCTISGSPAVDKSKNLLFRNCNILSPSSPVMGTSGTATFVDCNINSDFSQHVGGNARAYNCVVNDADTAYVTSEEGTIREVSGVYRIGGSNGTLRIRAALTSATDLIFDNLQGIMEAGKSSASIYFASVADILTNNEPYLIDFFMISEGVPIHIACTLEVDSESQWDGIVANVNRYKVVADISGYNYDVGADYNFTIFMHISPDIEKDFYFDLDTKLTA